MQWKNTVPGLLKEIRPDVLLRVQVEFRNSLFIIIENR